MITPQLQSLSINLTEKNQKKICLNYHNIGYGWQIGVNRVNPIIFKNHIRVIKKIASKNSNLEITLTFDDGYENIYTYAQGELNGNSTIKKKIFIIKDYIGKENSWDFSFYINRYKHLNKEQIKSLSNSKWEIGSHGVSHQSFLSMDNNSAKKEIEESKKYLEDITGREVSSIAPPFSGIDQKIYDFCVEVGYKSIYIQKKVNLSPVDDLAIYIRKNVYSIDNNYNIIKKINSNYMEDKKQNLISSFNKLTVFFSKYL